MLTFAIDKGLIEVHALVRFRMLPGTESVLRVMSEQETRVNKTEQERIRSIEGARNRA